MSAARRTAGVRSPRSRQRKPLALLAVALAALVFAACAPSRATAPSPHQSTAEPASTTVAGPPSTTTALAPGDVAPAIVRSGGLRSDASDDVDLAIAHDAAVVKPEVLRADGAIAPRCATCPAIQPNPTKPAMAAPEPGKPALLVSRVNTTDPVVFITIDDGQHANAGAAALFAQARLPISLFLTESYVVDKKDYIRGLIASGAWIESHTLTHLHLPGAGNPIAQICRTLDDYEKDYPGKVGRLFRPPGGAYNSATLSVAGSCGYKGVMLWKETTNNGEVQYQEGQLKAGDVILMHFRPDLEDNLRTLFSAINARGLRVGRLECYVGGDPRCATDDYATVPANGSSGSPRS